MTDKFIKDIIRECKKQKVGFEFHREGLISVITQIICTIASISCLIVVIVLIGGVK